MRDTQFRSPAVIWLMKIIKDNQSHAEDCYNSTGLSVVLCHHYNSTGLSVVSSHRYNCTGLSVVCVVFSVECSVVSLS